MADFYNQILGFKIDGNKRISKATTKIVIQKLLSDLEKTVIPEMQHIITETKVLRKLGKLQIKKLSIENGSIDHINRLKYSGGEWQKLCKMYDSGCRRAAKRAFVKDISRHIKMINFNHRK
jgi:hypothetical protein